MKTGRTVPDLISEVTRQAALKNDYLAKTSSITMVGGLDAALAVAEGADHLPLLTITDTAHGQIADYLDIPNKFYKRLRSEYPDSFDHMVNAMFTKKATPRLIRTLDGNLRGFLSDRYRRRDNFDLLEAILPVLSGFGDLRIVSCEVTETRMYLKFLSTHIEGEVKPGDVVQAGAVITNSEIGFAATSVFPFLNRLICSNGAIVNDFGQRRYHIGKRIEGDGDNAMELYSDATLEADDHAFWMKIADTVRAVVDPEAFKVLLARLQETAGQRISGNPEKTVELLANRFTLNQDQRASALRHLVEDGNGFNLWGLSNAVTSVASEQVDYSEATRLETLGGTLITLEPSQWTVLAEAA